MLRWFELWSQSWCNSFIESGVVAKADHQKEIKKIEEMEIQ